MPFVLWENYFMNYSKVSELKVCKGDAETFKRNAVLLYKDHRPKSCGVGTIVKVTANGKSNYHRIEAAGGRKNEITLPAVSMQRLGLRNGDEARISITKANTFQEMMWALNDIEPTNRIAAKLAILSVCLGSLSVALAIVL